MRWLLLFCLPQLVAESWTTYRSNNHRSSVTTNSLPNDLKLKWQWKSTLRPQTAWSGPAKWDAYSKNEGLQSLRNFDPAFYVTGQNNELFFGSSVDNSIHCIDLETGKEKWVYFTEGPVRFPPTLLNDKLVFGSDDGCVYAIDYKGNFLWKYQVIKNARKIFNNGKLISTWPVRTTILEQDHRLYFASSLVPWEPSYVCSIDSQTGKEIYKKEHQHITLEGAILAAAKQLIIPQGRASALMFDLNNGTRTGDLGNAGSTFILATEDNKLISGPKSQKGKNNVLEISDATTKTNMIQLDGMDHMIIDGPMAYFHRNGQLQSFHRHEYIEKSYAKKQWVMKKKKLNKTIKNKEELKRQQQEIDTHINPLTKAIEATTQWSQLSQTPISMMKADSKLICGFDGKVGIFNSSDGKQLQQFKVNGRVYGLAVWNNSLLVSTDEGDIVCFRL